MREGKEAQVVERNGLSFSITTRNFARLEMLTFPQTRASKLKKNLKIDAVVIQQFQFPQTHLKISARPIFERKLI